MTANDTDSPGQIAAKRLRFDRYVLDLDRGCLLLDGSEIVLRPKTFAVLLYLVENSGRLVSKDDLFAAVWPNLAVTDDTLVQSVGELRRALGDDGPRLIKTIPRRGYRFLAPISHVIAVDDALKNGSQTNSVAAHAPEPDAIPLSVPDVVSNSTGLNRRAPVSRRRLAASLVARGAKET